MSPHTELLVSVDSETTHNTCAWQLGGHEDTVSATEKVIASMVETRQPHSKCYSLYMVAQQKVGNEKGW